MVHQVMQKITETIKTKIWNFDLLKKKSWRNYLDPDPIFSVRIKDPDPNPHQI